MTKERNDRYKRICQRAKELWEAKERPMDRHQDFWLAAMAEIDAHDPVGPGRNATGEDLLISRAVSALESSTLQRQDLKEKNNG